MGGAGRSTALIHGDLGLVGVPELFRAIADEHRTGLLLLTREEEDSTKREASIYFRGGQAYHARLVPSGMQLGARLVSAGLISHDDIELALEAQSREGEKRRMGELLLAGGLLTHEQLEAVVKQQIEDTIFEILRWPGGVFRFESEAESHEDVSLEVSVENLVMEGARRFREWHEITRRVPSLEAVPRFVEGSKEAVEVALTPEEWSFVSKVNGNKRISELAAECGFTDLEAGRCVFGLVTAGLLELELPAGIELPEDDPEVDAALDQLEKALAEAARDRRPEGRAPMNLEEIVVTSGGTVDPQPVVDEPVMAEPVMSEPEHEPVMPEPVMPEPEPELVMPELVMPEPVMPEPEPEPVMAEPEHELVMPEPVMAEPEHEPVMPEPVMPEPEPEPVMAEPEPELVMPEPVISEPEPEPVMPEPVPIGSEETETPTPSPFREPFEDKLVELVASDIAPLPEPAGDPLALETIPATNGSLQEPVSASEVAQFESKVVAEEIVVEQSKPMSSAGMLSELNSLSGFDAAPAESTEEDEPDPAQAASGEEDRASRPIDPMVDTTALIREFSAISQEEEEEVTSAVAPPRQPSQSTRRKPEPEPRKGGGIFGRRKR